MQASDATALVALLQSAYPAREFPPSSVAAYTDALMNYDFRDGKEAVMWIMRSSRFLPALAELVTAADDFARSRRASEQLHALPSTTHMTDEERKQAQDVMNKALANWRERHPEHKDREFLAPPEDDGESAVPNNGRTIWPGGVPQNYDPNPRIRDDGPACVMCGRRTRNDGGDRWYCPVDGWMQGIPMAKKVLA